MNYFRVLTLLVGSALITSCVNDQDDDYISIEQTALTKQIIALYGSKEALLLPSETDFENIPADPNNPITKEKIVLGKFLFHETAIASNSKSSMGEKTYSCASCHHAEAGFQSGMKQGIGEGGIGFGIMGETRVMNPDYDESMIDVQPILSPTIINSAYQKNMLWNGQFGATGKNEGTAAHWTPNTPKESNLLGFEGLETQAIAGLGVHRLEINEALITELNYITYFDAAFPNTNKAERYTKITAGLAIAAYERTVTANKAPFQQWLKGDETALSQEETAGAALFFGKGKCYSCHSGPSLSDMNFYALGMHDLSGPDVHGIVDEATKKGRGGFTKNPDDDYAFKTPTLYNLKGLSFLGHGGSFNSVAQVISYKNNARKENGDVPENKIDIQFSALGLTNSEITQLALFIENGLYDNDLARFVPESLPSNACFPNADEQSKEDMNCGG